MASIFPVAGRGRDLEGPARLLLRAVEVGRPSGLQNEAIRGQQRLVVVFRLIDLRDKLASAGMDDSYCSTVHQELEGPLVQVEGLLHYDVTTVCAGLWKEAG